MPKKRPPASPKKLRPITAYGLTLPVTLTQVNQLYQASVEWRGVKFATAWCPSPTDARSALDRQVLADADMQLRQAIERLKLDAWNAGEARRV